MLSDAALGALCATGSALCWALIGLLVRALSPAFNSVTLNAMRSVLGGALLVAWVVAIDGWGALIAVSPRAFWLLAISVLIAVGIGDTAFFESSKWLGLARAMTISMTYPLIAAILAAIALGERLTPQVALGSLVTLGGLALTVRAKEGDGAGRGSVLLGIGVATLASVAWAVSVVLLKPALAEVDAVRAQAIRLPVAGVVLWAAPWAWRMKRPSGGQWPAMLRRLGALGVLSVISSVLFVVGVQRSGVAMATVLSSTAPVFAIPLGFVFLGERVAPAAIAGTLVAIAGIAVLQY